MSQTIELVRGELSATVTTEGAWIETFAQANRPIFFPKQIFMMGDVPKLRGGCHVCLPNFGPGGDSGQPQHGYGRQVEWEIVTQSDTNVALSLSHGVDGYESLTSELRYELRDNGMNMELVVENTGQTDLPLSPGFHPYFATTDAQEVNINGQDYRLNELAEAQFLEGQNTALHINNSNYELYSSQLPTWAVWSDRLADYVCLEPTAAGNSFQTGSASLIQPGQTQKHSFLVKLAA
jgi:glucose-6-phosphate 1-epimerase